MIAGRRMVKVSAGIGTCHHAYASHLVTFCYRFQKLIVDTGYSLALGGEVLLVVFYAVYLNVPVLVNRAANLSSCPIT